MYRVGKFVISRHATTVQDIDFMVIDVVGPALWNEIILR